MADKNVVQITRKRGRGTSRRPCLNRNAQMARENREKKKRYVQGLENEVAQLKKENIALSNCIQKQGIQIKKLQADVSYYKSLLNNNSSITVLLKALNAYIPKLKKQTEKASQPNRKISLSNTRDSRENLPFSKSNKESSLDQVSRNFQDLSDNWRTNNVPDGKISKEMSETPKLLNKNFSEINLIGNENLLDKKQIDKMDNFTSFGSNMDNQTDMSLKEDLDLDQFYSFNSINNDIFSNLTQFDDITSDLGQDASSSCADSSNSPENFFGNQNNFPGMCLHINSDRVSLEFCSSCQMNSVNSEIE